MTLSWAKKMAEFAGLVALIRADSDLTKVLVASCIAQEAFALQLQVHLSAEIQDLPPPHASEVDLFAHSGKALRALCHGDPQWFMNFPSLWGLKNFRFPRNI